MYDEQEHEEPPNPDSGFKVEVAGGNPMSYGEMEPMQGNSALKTVYRGATALCELLVGRDSGPQLKYYLAAQLLASLNGWEWEEFKEMVDRADGDPDALADDWTMED